MILNSDYLQDPCDYLHTFVTFVTFVHVESRDQDVASNHTLL